MQSGPEVNRFTARQQACLCSSTELDCFSFRSDLLGGRPGSLCAVHPMRSPPRKGAWPPLHSMSGFSKTVRKISHGCCYSNGNRLVAALRASSCFFAAQMHLTTSSSKPSTRGAGTIGAVTGDFVLRASWVPWSLASFCSWALASSQSSAYHIPSRCLVCGCMHRPV